MFFQEREVFAGGGEVVFGFVVEAQRHRPEEIRLSESGEKLRPIHHAFA